ncbi:MAG: DUF2911 domain-containing protein [Ignavibacteriaceae bacterium]|nr:DUF2911 domain-containing protein [Ignavibacteriaceae bacterium]
MKNILNLFIIMALMFSINTFAQQNKKQDKKQDKKSDVKKVRVSPKAGVFQTIGITDVNVSYSRPGVKNRKIWGELVPYNKVWRAGADEATKITFSTDVMIEGKKLPAGAYSFFAIPGENEWTLIFNKVADQWGAFTYNEAEDALRIKVKPVSNSNHEWLLYSFTDMTPPAAPNSALLNLIWEKLEVSFKIEGKGDIAAKN